MVSNQLGHKGDVTERVYVHGYELTKAQLAEEFGELMFGDKTF